MMTESEDGVVKVWSFAIAENGELHVWSGIDMPEADNVVRVAVREDGDFVRISAADLPALRQLIGTETREIRVPTGPDAAAELDDMLTRIHAIMQKRAAELRGDDDEEPAAPGMGR